MTRSHHSLEVKSPESLEKQNRVPLLFVHGLGHSASSWDQWWGAATESGYPAYAMSLRGHGASTGSLHLSLLGHYRDDVIEVASSLPRSPVLIGHSMGALVCAMAAARQRVAGLVLVAGIPPHPGIGSLALVARRHPLDAISMVMGRTLRMRPEYLFERLDADTAASYIAKAGKESALAQHQILFHRPPRAPLGGAPVLCVGSTADRLVPLRDIHATARRYNAPVLNFDNIGHNMMQDTGWEKPWQAIESWLSESIRLPQGGR